MRLDRLILSLLLLAATAPVTRGAAEEGEAPAGSCVDQLRRRVAATNADEVCRVLTKGRDPRAGANLDAFTFREQDLGDGTSAYVFEAPPGGDAYAYRPSYHFAPVGGRLELIFDGEGLPVRYATDRYRVNGRWQIERTSTADIPGLYRKREVETWFWTGSKYERAFSRVTIEGAKDGSLNGTELVWNPEVEELYKGAGPSWTYRVQKGDTLSAISRRYGVSVAEIQRQNGIRDAGSLRLGQTLRYEAWKVHAR